MNIDFVPDAELLAEIRLFAEIHDVTLAIAVTCLISPDYHHAVLAAL